MFENNELLKKVKSFFNENKFVQGVKNLFNDVPKEYKKFKAFFKETYNKRIIYMYLIDAFMVTLIVEMLSRHSFMQGIYYLIRSPYVIICNAMIVLMTLSITLLMKRRIFGMAIISIVWVIFGIANSVLLSYRVTPFGAVDLMLIDNAIDIMNKYVSPPVYVLLVLAAVGSVAGLAYIWIRIPKVNHKIDIPRNVGAIAIICAIGMGSINLGIGSELLSVKFGNLANSYKEYGFVYCFINSLVNTGVDKPEDYSNETIDNITSEKTEANDEPQVTRTPNIIFLQLESFFDVNYLKDLTYSENPLPYFTALKENYPSGFFNVPIVGAGTVNTEFEIMTGMNLDDFGPGEYPFKTILKEKTCESMAYNLKNYGYKCHAVHNNTATFYSRNVVFSNLGYDTFTTIENMHVEKNTVGWAFDKYLTQNIIDCLKSSKKQDYIYTISVQGHGSYPSDPIDYAIKVEGMEDEDRKYSLEYYISQINEMDIFLNDLINALNEYGEETILVLYGDHLPSLGITEDELVNGDVYQTEYVIWSNFDSGYEDEDIESYQIQAKILAGLNMTAGDINYYSQQHRKDEDQEAYLLGLKNLEYDMLYGEQLLYNGENPYIATDIQYGLEKVVVSSINPMYDEEGTIYIYGKNFTKYSRVYINGDKKNTEYMDESTLIVRYTELEEGDGISVYQQNSDSHVLTMTEPLVYENENLGKGEKETTTVEETTKIKKKKKKNKNNKDKGAETMSENISESTDENVSETISENNI